MWHLKLYDKFIFYFKNVRKIRFKNNKKYLPHSKESVNPYRSQRHLAIQMDLEVDKNTSYKILFTNIVIKLTNCNDGRLKFKREHQQAISKKLFVDNQVKMVMRTFDELLNTFTFKCVFASQLRKKVHRIYNCKYRHVLVADHILWY